MKRVRGSFHKETLNYLRRSTRSAKSKSLHSNILRNAPEYAVVSAGSLLGVAIHEGISFPVGKVESINIYPLSFREFLMAVGEDALARMITEKDYQTMKTFSDKFITWMKLYYFTGGMPEAVNDYAENGDVTSVREIQKQILELYENDFSKHTPEAELARLRNGLEFCTGPGLQKKIRSFNISS
mgnify:CR=1 FL=1